MKLAIALLLCLAITSNATRLRKNKWFDLPHEQSMDLEEPPAPDMDYFLGDDLPPENCVWFYEHARFEGQKEEICLGWSSMTIATINGRNDFYSSVKVGADVYADVYKDREYQNFITSIYGHILDFSDEGYNDQITSVKIGLKDPHNEKYCVRLFRWANYQGFGGGSGDRVCYGANVPKVSQTFPGHDEQYSSAKVGSKVYVTLYKNNNYHIELARLENDTPDFAPLGIDNQASSVWLSLRP